MPHGRCCDAPAGRAAERPEPRAGTAHRGGSRRGGRGRKKSPKKRGRLLDAVTGWRGWVFIPGDGGGGKGNGFPRRQHSLLRAGGCGDARAGCGGAPPGFIPRCPRLGQLWVLVLGGSAAGGRAPGVRAASGSLGPGQPGLPCVCVCVCVCVSGPAAQPWSRSAPTGMWLLSAPRAAPAPHGSSRQEKRREGKRERGGKKKKKKKKKKEKAPSQQSAEPKPSVRQRTVHPIPFPGRPRQARLPSGRCRSPGVRLAGGRRRGERGGGARSIPRGCRPDTSRVLAGSGCPPPGRRARLLPLQMGRN
ncbi:uncharacterized protein LOC118162402 [Oxyura jamaicensis]|uniref:uncharacterized protein LOC118162402 n=1 Tax=Oxyura jamaicensis TaxID=8884 RepID=UPI0015A54C11|nr:uncharacterized protein LOC118162402 [Oxyura jamaicensis]